MKQVTAWQQYVEGYGIRVIPKLPAVVVRSSESLVVHRLGIGSAKVNFEDGRPVLGSLKGQLEDVLTIEQGGEEREWRIINGTISCVLPIEMAGFLAGVENAIEFRFNRIAAEKSLQLPDGTTYPYGDDVIVMTAPQCAKLPNEAELTDEVKRIAALQNGNTKFIGVSTLKGTRGRARVFELATSPGFSSEARRQRSYLVSVGSKLVTITMHVRDEGLQVAGAFSDIIAASIRKS